MNINDEAGLNVTISSFRAEPFFTEQSDIGQRESSVAFDSPSVRVSKQKKAASAMGVTARYPSHKRGATAGRTSRF